MQIGADPDSTIDHIKEPSCPDSPKLLPVPSPEPSPPSSWLCSCICLLCLRLCPSSSQQIIPNGCYLPPQSYSSYGKKTLVLDLDETLVYSSFTCTFEPDIVIPVQVGDKVYSLFVKERPGVRAFLRAMEANFELVVFSASISEYAERVTDWLDEEQRIEGRLCREHCEETPEGHIKDLSRLGRDLRQVILLDVFSTQNSPISASYQPDNLLLISSFRGSDDTELEQLYPVFQALIDVEDVRPILKALHKPISQRMTIDIEDNRRERKSPRSKFDSSLAI